MSSEITSFKSAFTRNFLIVGGYTWGYQLVRFAFGLILARLLTPAEFGLIAIIQVFSGFMLMLGDMGLGYSIIDKSDYDYDKKIDNVCLWLGIFEAIILFGLAYPIAWVYGDMNLLAPTMLISVGFIFLSLGIVPKSILRRELKMGLLGRIHFISGIGSGVIAIILARMNFGYWTLVWYELSFFFFLMVLSRLYAHFEFNFGSFLSIRSSLSETSSLIKNITGFRIINYFARNWDNALIGKRYGNELLGYYNRGYSFIYLVLSSINSISSTFLFPIIKQSNEKEIVENSSFVIKSMALFSLPISSILILFPSELTHMLWGSQWEPVGQMLPYFGIILFIQMQSSVVGEIFIAIKKDKNFLILGIVNSLIMIVGITWGAMYSLYEVPRFYAFFNLLLAFVFTNYWAFYKSFGFPLKMILKIWGIGILILAFLLFFITHPILKILFLTLYWVHILVVNQANLKALLKKIT